ncbi:MAG: acyltransferase, partial [Hafnia sp.]
MEKVNRYIPQLTWLRGIAAILVVFSHIMRASENPYSAADIAADVSSFRFIDLGGFAVTLFFALSGATLYISHAHEEITKNIAPFLLKRILRVYPAYLLSMVVYITSAPLIKLLYGPPTNTWTDAAIAEYNWTDIWQHLIFIHDLIGKPFAINPPYWSLPVEFRYYLLFPIALIAIRYG